MRERSEDENLRTNLIPSGDIDVGVSLGVSSDVCGRREEKRWRRKESALSSAEETRRPPPRYSHSAVGNSIGSHPMFFLAGSW